MAGGRKSAYSIIEENLDLIRNWKRVGATDKQICEKLHISQETFYKYKRQKTEFADALKQGVEDLVIDLKDNLVSLARKHELVTVKTYEKFDDKTGAIIRLTEVTKREVDPNIGAIHLLLKNLDRDNWKEDWGNYELKVQEMRLKERMADAKEWQ